MASALDPFDPMEKAIHALAAADLRDGETLPGTRRTLARSYALSPDMLAMLQAWEARGKGWQVAAKGAPEAIADLCKLTDKTRAALTAQVDQMAGAGLRVLGVAEAAQAGSLTDNQSDFAFRFLGLVGLADPLRASVPAAVAQCRSAGIKVVMITGDYPATAQAIAVQAGLQGERVITGPERAAMSDADLAGAVTDARIFARIMPEQKLRFITALKAAGQVVAMTGDGVNDAPSLKAAHIGVAMGGRGTDVAREAASIVLLDDDFGSIVTTLRLGSRICDNLRKAMSFILAVHVPIARLALMPLMPLMPLLFGMPILFGPVHIAFREMVIDPVCSLVFEAESEEDGIMARPPRPSAEPLFSGPTILWSVLQGALVLGVTPTIFAVAPGYGLEADQVRGMTFAALVFGIVALILVDRSRSSSINKAILRPNRALAVVLPVVGSLLAVTLFWQPARDLFGFAALDPVFLAVLPAAGLVVLVVLEVLKPLWRWARRGEPDENAKTEAA